MPETVGLSEKELSYRAEALVMGAFKEMEHSAGMKMDDLEGSRWGNRALAVLIPAFIRLIHENNMAIAKGLDR
jgi:hypothetical protein